MLLVLIVNGESRELDGLEAPATLDSVIVALGLGRDRVAVEHNGAIASRSRWTGIMVGQQDRLEIVHFVGGGASADVRIINRW